MTSRELVKKTLEFKNYGGRVPRDLWTLPWAFNTYPKEVNEILENYPPDIITAKVSYKTPTIAVGDQHEIGIYIDPWGCKFENIQRGVIGEVKEPLVDPDDEEWADVSRIHIPEELLSFSIEEVNEFCRKTDKFVLCDCFPRPFEQLQFIRGTEQLYIDLMLRPEGLMEFIKKMHDFYCRLLTKWAQTEVDALYIMDDWGTQNSLLINPELWREIFKPMYKDYIDIAHQHGKKIFMHSDGYTISIIPDLIEIGLDALNCQIFCMGAEKLARFKGKITFWGEIDRQNLLPYGTVLDIKEAVESVMLNLWDNGGCIAQCEFGPGAKPENVEAVFAQWNK